MLDIVERIAVFIIIEGIFLRLTANEDYKKMIKICSGMILIIIVLSPLDEVFGFTQLVTDFLQEITGEERMEELREVYLSADEKSIEMVREEYEEIISESLADITAEYGYIVNDVEVVFDDTRENYIGSISVELVLAEEETQSVERIENVIINLDDNESENEAEIEAPDIIAIKTSIADTYGVEYEQIEIFKRGENGFY